VGEQPLPEPWRRSWRATLVRLLIGALLSPIFAGVATWAVVRNAATDPSTQGLVVVMMIFMALGWVLLFAWWIDHLIARFGRLVSLLVQVFLVVPVPLFMALDSSDFDLLSLAWVMAPPVTVTAVWMTVAWVPGAFPPEPSKQPSPQSP